MKRSPSSGAATVTPLALAAAGLDLCVHCGFCLQACPTYLALDDENDSPRGRLVLMRALVDGQLPANDPAVTTHIDRCLGCRGCESACPSGVPYGQLLEATRATIAPVRPAPLLARLVLSVFARPWLLGLAMGVARLARAARLGVLLGRLPGRAGAAFAMLEATRPPTLPGVSPAATTLASRESAAGEDAPARRAPTVAVLEGCVMRHLFAGTNAATRRVLERNGYTVVRAGGQRCCGALHAHAGDLEGARALARVNVVAFERAGAETIAVNSAGCGAAMKDYGHLLSDDAEWGARGERVASRVRDVSELLSSRGPVPGSRLELRVAWDAPCHLQHAQRVVAEPLSVLAAIPGLDLHTLPDADQCCGGAGIFSLLQPEVSTAVLRPKLAQVAATGAAVVVTANPGCLMQIGAGLFRAGSPARVVHPVDLLDASYRAAGAPR